MSSLLEWVAVGDALGLPFEFRKSKVLRENENGVVEDWSSRKGGRYYSHEEFYSGSTYSDDTQMMLMVARSLLKSKDNKYRDCNQYFKEELKSFMVYQQGAGRATRRACEYVEKDTSIFDKTYFHAGGNGYWCVYSLLLCWT